MISIREHGTRELGDVPATACQAMRVLADLPDVAGLDHAVRFPSDAYQLLGALEILADRERLVLRQIATVLTDLHAREEIVMDADALDADPARAVRDARRAIGLAVDLLSDLGNALDAARQPIAFAAYRGPAIHDSEQAR
jgi:hypothetical protein